MGKEIRLDKYLAEMGKGSRSQIKEAARKGRIRINGITTKQTDVKIDPDTDQVSLDGEAVVYRAMEYYMLNKPQGVISATEDPFHKTVTDLLGEECRRDLFPVGRLDIDTEGLLLLTNDGDLAHQLLAPKKHVDKQYYAHVEGLLSEDAPQEVAAGMCLKDGTPVRPGRLKVLSWNQVRENGQPVSEILLTIQEGKFHQVKRMFEALGCRVIYLKRISMGGLKLDDTLKPGQYRPFTMEELARLKQANPGLVTEEKGAGT